MPRQYFSSNIFLALCVPQTIITYPYDAKYPISRLAKIFFPLERSRRKRKGSLKRTAKATFENFPLRKKMVFRWPVPSHMWRVKTSERLMEPKR